MKKVAITWKNSIPVWWSFFWRFILMNVAVGAILLGLNIVLSLDASKSLSDKFYVFSSYFSIIVFIPISMWCIKCILNKKYSGYSVYLVEESSE